MNTEDRLAKLEEDAKTFVTAWNQIVQKFATEIGTLHNQINALERNQAGETVASTTRDQIRAWWTIPADDQAPGAAEANMSLYMGDR